MACCHSADVTAIAEEAYHIGVFLKKDKLVPFYYVFILCFFPRLFESNFYLWTLYYFDFFFFKKQKKKGRGKKKKKKKRRRKKKKKKREEKKKKKKKNRRKKKKKEGRRGGEGGLLGDRQAFVVASPHRPLPFSKYLALTLLCYDNEERRGKKRERGGRGGCWGTGRLS